MTTPPAEAKVMREAIFAGLTAFCSNQPDFDMSSGMKRTAADYILGQPGMFSPSTPSASAGELEQVRQIIEDLLQEHDPMCSHSDCQKTSYKIVAPLLAALTEARAGEKG
jgi:hypothetical protein